MPGESNPRAQISEADALAIRAARGGSETQRQLAKRYGISQTQVSKIQRGECWRPTEDGGMSKPVQGNGGNGGPGISEDEVRRRLMAIKTGNSVTAVIE